jgi:hypothetical protein
MRECDKSYGSENSLNQHIKLKHREIWENYKNKQNILNKEETMFFQKTLNYDLHSPHEIKVISERSNMDIISDDSL